MKTIYYVVANRQEIMSHDRTFAQCVVMITPKR